MKYTQLSHWSSRLDLRDDSVLDAPTLFAADLAVPFDKVSEGYEKVNCRSIQQNPKGLVQPVETEKRRAAAG